MFLFLLFPPSFLPLPFLHLQCTTLFYCLFLMHYYDTWDNPTSWTYLSMHGTYGLLWCLKEMIFPDANWQKPCMVMSHVIVLVGGLVPYWYFAFSINSKGTEAPLALSAACNAVHTLGCVLMMASDSQKYYVLKVKKGLISDGWFKYCRNTNYLGEVMIYGSYAALSQDWISWAIVLYVWTLVFGR